MSNVYPLPRFLPDGAIAGYVTVEDKRIRDIAEFHDAAEPVRHFAVEVDEGNVYRPVEGGFITEICIDTPAPDATVTYLSGRHHDTVREFMPFPHQPIQWYLIHGDDGQEYAVKHEAML